MVRPLTIAVALCVLSGCGGYASTSEAFRRSMTSGQPEAALTRVNQALGVDRAEQMPSKPQADTPLLLLERGTILQALGQYKLSSRDLQMADKQLDVLDLTADTGGQISKYLFSDDATVYKAPPYEKLLLNTVNMINYLVRRDTQGAKVEARRMVINRKFFEGKSADETAMLALGSYLSGFAFEAADEPGPAMRHYGDAHDAGGLPTLSDAVKRLAARTGADDPRFGALTDSPPALPSDDAKQGEVLVIVQVGMAPFLVPERLPIGAAVVSASDPGPGYRLSAAERRRANTFAAKGALKWVQYPRLVRSRSRSAPITVEADGRALSGGLGLDVEGKALAQYDKVKGSLIAASLTRMLTRAIAGEATQAVSRAAAKDNVIGLLAGLAVEGAMTAADTPDTRSWVTLPARFHLARGRLPAGKHTITVRLRGLTRQAEIDLRPGGWAVVNFSDLR